MQQGLMGDRPHNPVIATKKPEDATPRDRVLDDHELAAIWRACEDDDSGKIVRLLTLTACRRDEIGGLRRSEIKSDGTLMLPAERVKNGHKHTLPLMPTALSIIGDVHERSSRDQLFGDRSAGASRDGANPSVSLMIGWVLMSRNGGCTTFVDLSRLGWATLAWSRTSSKQR